VVPTLNEAERIAPCLAGLAHQTAEVREIVVVDSRSTDGTADLVRAAQGQDPRFCLLTDDPLPSTWVGRPWALHYGYTHSSPHSKWVLGIDADTQPQPGLVAALISAAEADNYDLVSLSPQFILHTPGEIWLQPALLMTLVYRFGPAGAPDDGAERVMANGQCFLCRRELLDQIGGYTVAKQSFCDDVTLARHAAQRGAKVGFWDGAFLLKVRMYEGWRETWQEWGRSLDLKDASSTGQVWSDLWFLASVQALPWLSLPVLLLGYPSLTVQLALGVNSLLIAVRFALQFAISSSYDLTQAQGRWLFWLSPLADPLAVLRIGLSSFRTPTSWRGRQYDKLSVSNG
ncbi:MAG: glycosyltransferase family 2 protein, partial [Cyanobacteria bacterium P01_H01_bin.105]